VICNLFILRVLRFTSPLIEDRLPVTFVAPRFKDVRLVKRLKKAGNTIISKKGATEYGPAFAISNLISTIITDSHKILTVSNYLEGEIGDIYDVSIGVPAVLSKNGIAMIVPIHMNDFEEHEFRIAADVIKETTDEVLKSLNG
jgi:malate dehydrogenase